MSPHQRRVIARRLHEIEQADPDGVLRPSAVVEDARDENSPLHRLFCWDEAVLVQQALMERAREVIRSYAVRVEVRSTRQTYEVPSYVRDPDRRAREDGYVSVARLQSDAERAQRALVSEFDRVGRDLIRAESLARELGVGVEAMSAIEDLHRRLTRLRDSLAAGGSLSA